MIVRKTYAICSIFLVLSRSFHKYAHVFLGLGSGRGLKFGEKASEIAPSECPLERFAESLPMILEI